MFLSWNESTSPPHYICYVASFQVSHQLFRKCSLRWVSLTNSCWVSLSGQKNEMLARLWIFTALLKASNMTVFNVPNSCPGLKVFWDFLSLKTLVWKKPQNPTLWKTYLLNEYIALCERECSTPTKSMEFDTDSSGTIILATILSNLLIGKHLLNCFISCGCNSRPWTTVQPEPRISSIAPALHILYF